MERNWDSEKTIYWFIYIERCHVDYYFVIFLSSPHWQFSFQFPRYVKHFHRSIERIAVFARTKKWKKYIMGIFQMIKYTLDIHWGRRTVAGEEKMYKFYSYDIEATCGNEWGRCVVWCSIIAFHLIDLPASDIIYCLLIFSVSYMKLSLSGALESDISYLYLLLTDSKIKNESFKLINLQIK